MSRNNKDWEARMQGMVYAYNIAKEGGIEALETDLRRRNVLKAPIKFSSKELYEWYQETTNSMYNNMLTGVLFTLHDKYGFGQKRLDEFLAEFNYNVGCTLNLDYMGEHYVKMEDYAIELNEKYNMGIDINRVAASQDFYDEKEPKYRMCKVDMVLQELRRNGFAEAAEFLNEKMRE